MSKFLLTQVTDNLATMKPFLLCIYHFLSSFPFKDRKKLLLTARKWNFNHTRKKKPANMKFFDDLLMSTEALLVAHKVQFQDLIIF